MSESTTRELTISFECPVCERTVEITASQHHNLTIDGEYHGPTITGTPDHDCPVYFRKDEAVIRREYGFIRYEMPTIFVQIPETVTDHDVFRALLDSTVGTSRPA